VNAARVTVRAWTLGLRAALGELAAVGLRWCLLCGRVGLWGWQPLTPSMPITFVCANRIGCQQRQASRRRARGGGGGGSWCEGGRGRPGRGSGPAPAPPAGAGPPGPPPPWPATAGPSPQ
jgi:hypothetical protein